MVTDGLHGNEILYLLVDHKHIIENNGIGGCGQLFFLCYVRHSVKST